jgi:hypothetical protein
MSLELDLKERFAQAKEANEQAQKGLRAILTEMIEAGMAKKVEDGYGGDHLMAIVADPVLLKQIEYFIWGEEDPEFWGPDNGPLTFEKGAVEWF